MLKVFEKNNVLHTIFVIAQAVLLTLILLEFCTVKWLCFATVVLACIHTLIYVKNEQHGLFFALAMLFTVVSDVFLVLIFDGSDIEIQSVGMTTFSIAQVCYFLYIYFCSSDKKFNLIHLVTRIALCSLACVLAIIVLADSVNYLAVITMFYFANLLLNAVFSFLGKNKNLTRAIAFVFFICCDIFVGAQASLGLFLTVSENTLIYWIAHPPINFTWLFYVVSQTLLSISICYKKDIKR